MALPTAPSQSESRGVPTPSSADRDANTGDSVYRSRGFAPTLASLRPDNTFPESESHRQRFPPAGSDVRGRSPSRHSAVSDSAPIPAMPRSADSNQARSENGHCWPPGASAAIAVPAPSQSNDPELRIAMPPRPILLTPPTRLWLLRRTRATRRLYAAIPGSGACASVRASALVLLAAPNALSVPL